MDYDKVFRQHLPDSLYLNHYELADAYGGSPDDWRRYLNENQQFIALELAVISEAQARKALKTLGGENTQQQVAGLKEIIRTSNLLSEKTQNRQSYVLLNQPTEIDHEFPLYVRLGLGEYTHPVTLYFDLAQYLHDKDLNQVKYRFFTQDEWKAHFRKIRDNLLDGNIPLTMTKPEKRVDYDFDFDI